MTFITFYTLDSVYDQFALQDFFWTLDIPKVDRELAADLEEAITIPEIGFAIKGVQSGKSPGPDGFTSEFIKK